MKNKRTSKPSGGIPRDEATKTFNIKMGCRFDHRRDGLKHLPIHIRSVSVPSTPTFLTPHPGEMAFNFWKVMLKSRKTASKLPRILKMVKSHHCAQRRQHSLAEADGSVRVSPLQCCACKAGTVDALAGSSRGAGAGLSAFDRRAGSWIHARAGILRKEPGNDCQCSGQRGDSIHSAYFQSCPSDAVEW